MKVYKKWIDKQAGYTHIRYQQYHKGLNVEFTEITEHGLNNFVEIMNGSVCENLDISSVPNITEEEALSKTLDYLGSEEYFWEDEERIKDLEENSETPNNNSYFPKGTLLYGCINDNETIKENYKLTWKFTIKSVKPFFIRTIYVDAHTGLIVKERQETNNNGPAVTMYNGTQQIDTDWYGGFVQKHILKANNNGRNIHTKYGTSGDKWWKKNNVKDSDDNWTGDIEATSAHWGATEAWDFFDQTYGIRGVDGNGRLLRVWANANVQNANYIPDSNCDYLQIGTINGNYLAAIDIMGHEFTHGIDNYSAELVYELESGALDESFADIFGFMIERFAQGGVINDWLIGEDAIALRNMSNPNASLNPQPSVFGGANWVGTAGCTPTNINDFCGVHTNSGVQNFWFFLLSQGGNQLGVNVQGIGVDQAAAIAHYNHVNMLQSNSGFADSRDGAIAASRILYGRCSPQEFHTTSAWAAVGVGAVPQACINISGVIKICEDDDFPITLSTNQFPQGLVNWSGIPNSWTTTTSGINNENLVILNADFPSSNITANTFVGGELLADEHFVTYSQCIVRPGTTPFTIPGCIGCRVAKLNQEVSLYPNPSTNYIAVELKGFEGKKADISIINLQGIKVIDYQQETSSSVELDISKLPSGRYFIKVTSDNFSNVSSFIKL